LERSGNILARRLSWLLEYAVCPHRGELQPASGGQDEGRWLDKQHSDEQHIKQHNEQSTEPLDEPQEVAWILELPRLADSGGAGADARARARARARDGAGDSAGTADAAAVDLTAPSRARLARERATARRRPGSAIGAPGGRLGGAARTGAPACRPASAVVPGRAAAKGRAAALRTEPVSAPGAASRGTPTVQAENAVSDEELFNPWTTTTAAATITISKRLEGRKGEPVVPSKSPVVLERRTPVAAVLETRKAARDGAKDEQGEGELVIPAYVLGQQGSAVQAKPLRGQSSVSPSSLQTKPRPPVPAVPPKLVGPVNSPLHSVATVTSPSPRVLPHPPAHPPQLVLPGLAKSTPRPPSPPLQAPAGRAEQRDSPSTGSCKSKADKSPLASGPSLSSRSEVSLFAFNGGDCALPNSPIEACSPISCVLPPLGSSGSLSQSSCSLSSCSLSSGSLSSGCSGCG
jgi:hypothetical protein